MGMDAALRGERGIRRGAEGATTEECVGTLSAGTGGDRCATELDWGEFRESGKEGRRVNREKKRWIPPAQTQVNSCVYVPLLPGKEKEVDWCAP